MKVLLRTEYNRVHRLENVNQTHLVLATGKLVLTTKRITPHYFHQSLLRRKSRRRRQLVAVSASTRTSTTWWVKSISSLSRAIHSKPLKLGHLPLVNSLTSKGLLRRWWIWLCRILPYLILLLKSLSTHVGEVFFSTFNSC